MKKAILGFFLLMLLASPCAADTVTLTAGDSMRWNFTLAQDYIWQGSWDPYTIFIGEELPDVVRNVDLEIRFFDHFSDATPFYWQEFSPFFSGATWWVNPADNLARVLDGDVAVEILMLSGTATFQEPTVFGNFPQPVPLPPTVLLFGSGLLGLVGWRKLKKG